MDAKEETDAASDAILVTGHRPYGAVATDLPPEVNLNAAAIGALGAADLSEVFADLAPELNNGAGAAGRGAPTPIVLVNGQRIAGFSSIRDLPPEAVRRIEVFPQKVALQYGFRGDQKVVNVVLRRDYHALTLLGRYTAAPENWRGIYRAKVDLLHIADASHWNVDLDYSHFDPIFADTTLPDPGATQQQAADVPAHTLATQSDDFTVSGDYVRDMGALTADLVGRLHLGALQSRLGLTDSDGALLDQQGAADLVTGPRYRSDRTADAHTNLTLNGSLDRWRWSFIGRLDELTHKITTGQDAISGSFDAIQLPSPSMIGTRCASGSTACVVTTTRSAGGDFYLNGEPLKLPAGGLSLSLRSGFAFSGITGQSSAGMQDHVRDRDEGNVQANVDVPLTVQRSAIGKLSVGFNGELRRLSDYGSLSVLGSTLQWAPVKPVEIIASVRREDDAPSLEQLAAGTLATPDLRVFDFVTDQTSIVQRVDGGNGALRLSHSRIANLRVQANPLPSADLQLSAEYTIDRTRDPIVVITAATAASAAALPQLYARNADSFLTGMDISPVNAARRDQQRLHYGLSYSTAFGPRGTEPTGEGGKPATRDQFQIALYDTWRLQDRLVLRQGAGALDLLGGDLISDQGGTPAHEIELQTTVATRLWSADVNARWQTRTTAYAGAQDRLTFSQGVTLNLRVQINLAEQPWIGRLLPFLRGKLNLSADNLLGAHTVVRNAAGIVPAAYSESYLNPTGRTFRITLRKRFH